MSQSSSIRFACPICGGRYEITSQEYFQTYHNLITKACNRCGTVLDFSALRNEMESQAKKTQVLHDIKMVKDPLPDVSSYHGQRNSNQQCAKDSSVDNDDLDLINCIFDWKLISYFFGFTWMRYSSPAARFFDKIATVNSFFCIITLFFLLCQVLDFLDGNKYVFGSFWWSNILLCSSIPSVIINRIIGDVLEQFLGKKK